VASEPWAVTVIVDAKLTVTVAGGAAIGALLQDTIATDASATTVKFHIKWRTLCKLNGVDLDHLFDAVRPPQDP